MKKYQWRIVTILLSSCFIVGLILLIYSFFYYGYRYVLDNDELHHTQLTYLIAHGFLPYKDIYMTVYTPIFEWTLLPFYRLNGFSFDTIFMTRFFMVILLLIRTVFGSLILFELFGLLPALLFPLLSLSDPFTQVSGIQIRSDNLMILIFIIGVYVLIKASRRKSDILFIFSGSLFALSALTLLKIAPGVAFVCSVTSLFLLIKKRFKTAISFITGFFATVLLFFGYFIVSARGYELFMQLIAESFSSYSKFDYPVQLGFFYKPDNTTVFGYPGKPFTWFYLLSLPYLAIIGGILTLIELVRKKRIDIIAIIKFSLVGSAVSQALFLLTLTSVFIQHYMVVSVFFTFFTSITVSKMYTYIKNKNKRFIISAIGLILLTILLNTSINANIIRARSDARWVIAAHQKRWQQIPANSAVFPNYLFRPLAYPVPYGHYIGNMPDEIRNRLPDIKKTLEDKKVPYLLEGYWHRRYLSSDTIEYIDSHYHFLPGEDELMERNELVN